MRILRHLRMSPYIDGTINKAYYYHHCPPQSPAKVCQTAIPNQMPWPAWNCTGAVSLFAYLSPGMIVAVFHIFRHLKV